jgi:hypothetical protein
VQVIIAEPIRNMASSRWGIAAAIARRFTDPGDGPSARRFNEQTFDEFFAGVLQSMLSPHAMFLAAAKRL